MKRRFIAIGPNYWGSGNTEKDALREMRKAGASPGIPYNMYDVEGEFEISPIDGTLYTGADKCRKVGEGKLRRS